MSKARETTVSFPSVQFHELLPFLPEISKKYKVRITLNKIEEYALIQSNNKFSNVKAAALLLQSKINSIEEEHQRKLNNFFRPSLRKQNSMYKRTSLSPNEISTEIQVKVNLLTSYTHLATANQTIQVPGEAPLIQPVEEIPVQLKPPRGKVPVDRTATWMGSDRSLFPLFAAVLTSFPKFDFSQLDLVTDRNNIRKLIDLFTGSENRKMFRIDYQLIGSTLAFIRREEKLEGEMSFGHRFEKILTKLRRSDRDSFHVINQVDLGPLKLLVRAEIDALLPNNINNNNDKDEVGDLEKQIGSLKLSKGDNDEDLEEKRKRKEELKVTVWPGGRGKTEENEVTEITSFHIRKEEDWLDRLDVAYPQLIFGGASKLVVGVREKDMVKEIKYMNVDEVLTRSNWIKEGKWNNVLWDLIHFLQFLKEFAENGNEKGSVVCDGRSRHLEIYSCDHGDIVPLAFFAR